MQAFKSIFVAVLAAVGFMAFAQAADANVRVVLSDGPSAAKPETLVAGGHPDLALRMSFPDSATDPTRNVDVDLPAGMIGNPGATAICTVADLNGAGCPGNTQIGEVTVNAKVTLTGVTLLDLIPLDQEIHGKLYNAEPAKFNETTKKFEPVPGRPAAIAAVLTSDLNAPPLIEVKPITTVASWKLRSPGDYGLTNELRDLPTSTPISGGLIELALALSGKTGNTVNAKVQLDSMQYVFWGDNKPGRNDWFKTPYTINPTECTPQSMRARAAGASAPTDFGAEGTFTFTPTGCESIKFDPGVGGITQTVTPSAPVRSEFTAKEPTGVTVELKMPAPDKDPQWGMVSRAEVPMPVGIALSAGVGSGPDGLAGCTDEQFGYNTDKDPGAAGGCPGNSKIGTVSFDSPLVGELTGDVYVGTSTADAKLREFVYVARNGIQVKLVGKTVPDPVTGQLMTIFDDLPRQPFTSFKLNFRGGPTAVLKAPDTCGTASATGTLTSFTKVNGQAKTAALPASITTGGCKPRQFAPTIEVGADPTQAGADTSFTTVISRTDDDDRLDGQQVSLPAGLLGRLAAIKTCPVADARVGNCNAESQIGFIDVEAGTGPAPAELGGDVYLTDGFDGGIAGLAIVIAAKVGPVDLGKTVVIGKMTTRKDVGIDLTIASTPSIQEGVPLYLKKMTLKLSKPGFMFNASSCAVQQVTASFTSVEGSSATSTAPYQATNCEALPFDPQMTAKVTGNKTQPGFTTTIVGRQGDSTLRDTVLKLPPALGASLSGVGRACTETNFRAGTCAQEAVIGTVRAESNLIPLPLTGPITLFKPDKETLPALGLALRGPISLDLEIKNSIVGGRLTSTIAGVPDTPIDKFDLVLSPNALLQANGDDLCSGNQTVDGNFVATTGKVVNKTVPVDVSAVCGTDPQGPVSGKASLKGIAKGKKASLTAKISGKGRKLTSLKVSVPKANLKFVAKKVKGNARGVVGGKYTAKSKKLSSGTSGKNSFLTVKSSQVSGKSGGASSIQLNISKGALAKAKIKVGQRIKIKLTYTEKGSSKAKTITVTVKAGK